MASFFFPLAPVSKPRQTRSDVWKKRPCVLRYREFADKLRRHARAQGYTWSEGDGVTFVLPMPESWSLKKRATYNDQPHRQKPDIDNLLKAFLDALMPEGDETVAWIGVLQKRWGRESGILVECHGF